MQGPGSTNRIQVQGMSLFWRSIFLCLIFPMLISAKVEGAGSGGSLSNTSAAAQALTALDWMIGIWEFSLDSGTLSSRIEHSPSGNYILRTDQLRDQGSRLIHEEKTIIAWNPVSELFETWAFRSDGSFGGGILEQYGDQWSAPIRMILYDARTSTATNLYTPQENGGFIWESISRTLDDLALPNIPPTLAVPIRSTNTTLNRIRDAVQIGAHGFAFDRSGRIKAIFEYE